MIEKKQIDYIRRKLIAHIRHTVEKQNGCISTFYKTNGEHHTENETEEEYCTSPIVVTHNTDISFYGNFEAATLYDLFIDKKDGGLKCTLNGEAGEDWDEPIENIQIEGLHNIAEWLVENGFDTDTEDATLYCSECGFADVEVMAWVKINEGKMFSTDIGGNNDEESNYCESCGEHPRLLTRTELMEHIQSWWEDADSNTREKITGISISRFDGGEIPAYESACQASWDALTDDEKIATWQKYKKQ